MTPLFEFHDVRVSSGTADVLNGVTAAIPDRRLTVIAGASGSGKTSLLRLCNRLDVPTSGRIAYRGEDLLDLDPRRLRRRVGMVFQQPALFPGTVRDNLLAAAPKAAEEDLRSALTSVDIDGLLLDRVADTLSGGEAQRVCLARTLMCRPEVLLMDEPTASVHPAAAAILEENARRLSREGGVGVIWVTHDLGQIGRLAEFLLVLENGRVRYTGNPETAAATAALECLTADGTQ
ncbi:MAG: ATP-binding cassette domain-containing protein [Acidimicrobiia bacterium]|nr:ATP-binding cassette domain-containing protein [Acidimicrobiia bacterium]